MDSIENINQSYVNTTNNRQEYEDNTIMNHDSFLKLFIESLKNQDPLEPMEQSEMMAQITNLALMESVENMKSMIETLSMSMNDSMNVSSNVHLIGKIVKVENSEGEFEGKVISVGRQGTEAVFEMEDGNYYLVDTIVGIKETSNTDEVPKEEDNQNGENVEGEKEDDTEV